MNNRIKEIIAAEHLSDGEFADIVGIKRSTLSHCLSGRNDVSKDIITKIHNAYPYISINWLMFGEGKLDMSKKSPESANLFNSVQYFEQEETSVAENRKDLSLNSSELHSQSFKNEVNSVASAPVLQNNIFDEIAVKEKKIEKIMVFYSDNTFEVFEK